MSAAPLPWPLSLAEHFQLQYLVLAAALASTAASRASASTCRAGSRASTPAGRR